MELPKKLDIMIPFDGQLRLVRDKVNEVIDYLASKEEQPVNAKPASEVIQILKDIPIGTFSKDSPEAPQATDKNFPWYGKQAPQEKEELDIDDLLFDYRNTYRHYLGCEDKYESEQMENRMSEISSIIKQAIKK